MSNNNTFTPDPNGYAETFIAKYDLTPQSAKVIRNYQRALFNYVMATRDGDYTLADRYAKIAQDGTPVAYYRNRGWNWAGGEKIDEGSVTRFRDEVLRMVVQMEVK